MNISTVRVSLTGNENDVRELLETYHSAANQQGEEWFSTEDFGAPVDEIVARDIDRLATATLDEPLFLAVDNDDDVLGTVQLKQLDETTAEVKRLYVSPEYRGRGVGRQLVRNVLEETASDGFDTLRLGVAPYHESAQQLYEDVGFEYTPPYEGTNCPEELHEVWNFMAYSHTG